MKGEDHSVVEALLNQRIRGNSWQYLVRWLGYGTEHDEWIHEKELADEAEPILRLCKDNHGLL